ncbi:MAG: TGS domain-containing protein [Firmicutes bacterium]|nr:TGS domain-containing protein [Bacillota bacterium]
MPANLTPQYYVAEEAYRRATTLEKKIEALQEMLAVIPKHKGTEKIQGNIKRRLSKLREAGEKRTKTAGFNPYFIEKQGAGQAILIGYPNVGKSSLVAALTRARPKIADFPFTTTLPLAGMMPFKNILIQLVDTPPLTADGLPSELLNTLQSGDLLLAVLDMGSDECLEQAEETLSYLREKKLIDNEKGGGEGCPVEKADIESAQTEPKHAPYLIIGNKCDHPHSEENTRILHELLPGLPFISISAKEKIELTRLKKKIYQKLNIIRVYTRAPGEQPNMQAPFVLKCGSTVLDLANNIHRDFPQLLKSARVWGSSKFEGQTVAREYILKEGDIVEINV